MNDNSGGGSGGTNPNAFIGGPAGTLYPPGGGGGGGGTYPGGGGGSGGGTFIPSRPPMFSMNGRFIVEPYMSDRQIKVSDAGGFAMIQQKVHVKGLRLLVAAHLGDNMTSHTRIDGLSQSGPITLAAGSLIFIREEYLFTQPWAKQILESDHVGKFIIVDKQFVEFIQPA